MTYAGTYRGFIGALFILSWLSPPPSAAQEVEPAQPTAPLAPDAAAQTAAAAPASSAGTGAEELTKLRAQTQALEARLAQLEQTQLATQALDASSAASAEVVEDRTFRIYGFADFGLNHAWTSPKSFVSGVAYLDTTFVLGNLNLYFDFRPDPAWQVLTEIRFTAYPHGAETGLANALGGEYTRVDTTVTDVASPATGSSFRWGSIMIERAYAQWSPSELFNVRVGQFLTPYGIWNVDHGTPTLIALMMPHFVSAQALPARQVGVEVHGGFLSRGWELGYDAYVSNGRTATQFDFTENKAFGGRLRLSRIAPLPVTLGSSFYYGQLDDVTKSIVSFDPFRTQRDIIVQGTEWGIGVDASLDIDALRIRTEGIMHAVRYDPGKRPEVTTGQPGSVAPDVNEYNTYLLLAYRLPVWGLEPFLYAEYCHVPSAYGDDQLVLSAGLNIHFASFAQLKTQVARAHFFDWDKRGPFADNDMTLLFSRLAVAF